MKKSELKTMVRHIVREEVAMAINEVVTELKQPTFGDKPIGKLTNVNDTLPKQKRKKIVKENIPVDKINEKLFSSHLDTSGIPDPDLIIRTGGDKRLSGYLPWQSVYSELYFTNTLFPDFTPEKLKTALKSFATRNRRFGGN